MGLDDLFVGLYLVRSSSLPIPVDSIPAHTRAQLTTITAAIGVCLSKHPESIGALAVTCVLILAVQPPKPASASTSPTFRRSRSGGF